MKFICMKTVKTSQHRGKAGLYERDTEKSKMLLFFVFVFPLSLCVSVLRGFFSS